MSQVALRVTGEHIPIGTRTSWQPKPTAGKLVMMVDQATKAQVLGLVSAQHRRSSIDRAEGAFLLQWWDRNGPEPRLPVKQTIDLHSHNAARESWTKQVPATVGCGIGGHGLLPKLTVTRWPDGGEPLVVAELRPEQLTAIEPDFARWTSSDLVTPFYCKGVIDEKRR